jgi:hypothetical protein
LPAELNLFSFESLRRQDGPLASLITGLGAARLGKANATHKFYTSISIPFARAIYSQT